MILRNYHFYFYLFLAFLLLGPYCAAEDDELIFVQILFRHGDRSPIILYPTDPNPVSVWPEGLGKLTRLGKLQHYALGKYFHKRYEKFSSFSPLEVKVLSGEPDRCIESAEVNVASFFAPTSNWSFEDDLKWQPIPIRYVPVAVDKYLEVLSVCPQADKEYERLLNSPEGQQILKEHQVMFDYLTAHSGMDIKNWTIANDLYDTLSVEKRYNLTVPKWTEPYWDELANVSNLSYFWDFNSPLLHKLRAGPLLTLILSKIDDKIHGHLDNQKVQIYSSHDSNIAVVLAALGVYNMIQPPYCASLIFELYRSRSTGDYLLRLLYLNSTNPEKEAGPIHLLRPCSGEDSCSLDAFRQIVTPLMVDDWNKECAVSALTFLYVSLACLFVLIIGHLIIVKKSTERRRKYEALFGRNA